MSGDYLSYEEMRSRGYDPVSLKIGRIAAEGRKEAAVLIESIREAFQNIARPRITLHVARGYDDEWNLSEERVQDLRLLDPEEDWAQLDSTKTDGFPEYFTFSDDEGWRFHLPAFMCNYLERFPGGDGYDAVYWACVQKTHMALLDERQLECVNRFVALCHKYESPTGGLRIPE